jgi:hypothetical protein
VCLSSWLYGQVVTTYVAPTDQKARVKPPLPAMGPAGSKITDPTFGSRILRVTDSSTASGYPDISYQTAASSEAAAWNADSSLFVVRGSGGLLVPFAFDAATLTARRIGAAATATGGLVLRGLRNVEFSCTDRNVIYGLMGTRLAKYNFQTDTYTPLFDLRNVVSNPGSIGDVSADCSGRLSVYFGGAAQNDAHYVLFYDPATGARRLLDTWSSLLNGQRTSVYLGWRLHNARLDKSGRYVVITIWNGPAGQAVWDVQAGTVVYHTFRSGGHKVSGFGYLINSDKLVGDYGPQWLLRRMDPSSLLKPQGLLPPAKVGPWWGVYNHLSWSNAQASALAPVLVSSYHDYRNGSTLRPMEDEILAVRTDGAASTVWRFAHHRAIYDGYFWDTPRGNVSPDGRYFVFTSNWDKTLGRDPGGRPRRDVFLVELAKSATTAPASPTQPQTEPATEPQAQPAAYALRINAGGQSFRDGLGQQWYADTAFTGGAKWSTSAQIGAASTSPMYQTVRYGVGFQYRIPLPNGLYRVTLKFAEVSQTSVGQRRFHVDINGVIVLYNFDVLAAAGGPLRPVDRWFAASVTGGVLTLNFRTGAANSPMISGIEVAAVP